MVFGHIHESAGVQSQSETQTLFVNACSVDMKYRVDVCAEAPRGVVVFDVEAGAGRATLVRPTPL